MSRIIRPGKGFGLVELLLLMAILGILALIAVPQFMRSTRMAKAAEVAEMLDLIKKGSAAYYTTPHTGSAGFKLACQFPCCASPTPVGAVTCCQDALDADNDERCDANPGAWKHTTWVALKFAMTDQHYYRYQYESSGTTDIASYTASAFGDLDCDTTQSTFKLYGIPDPKATMDSCADPTAKGIFRDHETE